MKYLICFAASMILCGGSLDASCAPIDPGTRLWDIASEDFVIDCETLSKVTIIDSKIDALNPCGATSLTGNDIELSASGVYCLANDIQGTLTISSSNVTLDLNGHVLTGTITTAPSSALQNIVIRNGIITVPMPPTGLTAITISGIDANNQAENIQLQDLAIYCNGDCMISDGGAIGIDINFATQVILTSVYCSSAVLTNIQINNTEDITLEASDFVASCSAGMTVGTDGAVNALVMRDCTFFENALYGVECIDLVNSTIQGCNFTSNGTGLDILGESNLLVIQDCAALAGSADGFVVQGSAREINFISCQAMNNGNSGFIITQNALETTFTNCQSINNNNGYYLLGSAQQVSFTACQSIGNSLFGFVLADDVQHASLISCLALANGLDGFELDDMVQQINLIECQAQVNGSHGFAVLATAEQIGFSACQASSNTENGFYLSASASEISLSSCQSNGNTGNGFLVEDDAYAALINCISNLNGISGFNIDNSSTAVVTMKECLAIANTSIGFNDVIGAASSSRYVACYAQGNATDYSTLGAPFNAADATDPAINYWTNTFSS